MELRYCPGDTAPKLHLRTFLKPGVLVAFLPALAWTLAEWVKAGPVYAFGVGAAGVLAVVAIRRRSLKLCVTADGRGVGTAGWFSKRRWDWDAISSIDYVPTRRRFVGTFYRGRVMLTSGQVHLVSALSGSVAGTKDADARHRAFIAQLREELDRRVPVKRTGWRSQQACNRLVG